MEDSTDTRSLFSVQNTLEVLSKQTNVSPKCHMLAPIQLVKPRQRH